MLSIRMTRLGAKKRPFYRIIVTERDAKRDGRFVEIVGHYDPIATPPVIKIDRDRYDYWMSKGAKPTDTVRRCLKTQEKAARATA
ncbi:MAG TPA: 30S ribosomal protein S16 [Blastocatellia bacterium]|nr:30S ribosomal protein S16 [Blastocatellia bacterium]